MRMDYLLETALDFRDPQDLLYSIVCAMSDREFDGVYQYICRMHDIEPDEDKYNAVFDPDTTAATKSLNTEFSS